MFRLISVILCISVQVVAVPFSPQRASPLRNEQTHLMPRVVHTQVKYTWLESVFSGGLKGKGIATGVLVQLELDMETSTIVIIERKIKLEGLSEKLLSVRPSVIIFSFKRYRLNSLFA